LLFGLNLQRKGESLRQSLCESKRNFFLMIGIKRTIIISLIILVLMMLLALVLPGKISLAKSVDITGERDCAENMDSDFIQRHKWFPVLRENLGKIQIHSPKDATIIKSNGSKIDFRFQSKTPDSIVLVMSNQSARPFQLQFLFKSENNGSQRLNLIVNTELNWYPWERAKGIFLDKIRGEQYQEVVDNIASGCRQ